MNTFFFNSITVILACSLVSGCGSEIDNTIDLCVSDFKCGLYDVSRSALLTNPDFQLVSILRQNRVAVVKDGKVGYLDSSGVNVVNPKYDDANDFSDIGIAAVSISGKWGYIDTAGREVIPIEFDGAEDFSSNGIAAAKTKNLWGYIKKDGSWLVKPQFETATKFSNANFAIVKFGKSDLLTQNRESKGVDYEIDNVFYKLLSNGEISTKFSGVFVSLSENGLIKFSINNKFGFANSDGKVIAPAIYDTATDFDGKNNALVSIGGKYYVMNMDGRHVNSVPYDEINAFAGPYAAAKLDGKWGVIDRQAKRIIDFKYQEVRLIDNSNLVSVNNNNKWEYVSLATKESTKVFFDNAFPVWKFGIGLVRIEGSWYIYSEKKGVINESKGDSYKFSRKDGYVWIKNGINSTLYNNDAEPVVRISTHCGKRSISNANNLIIWPKDEPQSCDNDVSKLKEYQGVYSGLDCQLSPANRSMFIVFKVEGDSLWVKTGNEPCDFHQFISFDTVPGDKEQIALIGTEISRDREYIYEFSADGEKIHLKPAPGTRKLVEMQISNYETEPHDKRSVMLADRLKKLLSKDGIVGFVKIGASQSGLPSNSSYYFPNKFSNKIDNALLKRAEKLSGIDDTDGIAARITLIHEFYKIGYVDNRSDFIKMPGAGNETVAKQISWLKDSVRNYKWVDNIKNNWTIYSDEAYSVANEAASIDLSRSKDIGRAIDKLKVSIALDPLNIDTALNLSYLFLKRGSTEDLSESDFYSFYAMSLPRNNGDYIRGFNLLTMAIEFALKHDDDVSVPIFNLARTAYSPDEYCKMIDRIRYEFKGKIESSLKKHFEVTKRLGLPEKYFCQ
ncbi:WG repeat-containing protein [Dechloromonas sp. ZS-1]|uniref:WG repeat-containing protein n=1 Tax=Dechloromonas sp. ZS-1 TaxID=3138067 RepID=UPI0031FD964E